MPHSRACFAAISICSGAVNDRAALTIDRAGDVARTPYFDNIRRRQRFDDGVTLGRFREIFRLHFKNLGELREPRRALENRTPVGS